MTKCSAGQCRFFAARSVWCGLVVSLIAARSGADEPPVAVPSAVASITVEELRRHVSVLASDTFEGREAGARGGQAAGAWLVDRLKRLKVTPAGTSGGWYQSFDNGYRNVLALVKPTSTDAIDEVIVVGAHYDHVGFGNVSNSFGPWGRIHNGADDNASGCAVLLEVIDALTASDQPLRRSVLFAFWDAEEKNLLGSRYWVRHPTVPLRDVRLLLNVDMVGRLRESELEILGVRTAPGLRRLISRANTPRLTLQFNWEIIADSDHYPFVQRRIPYLMPFTRKHPDYHRPSDDVDKVNYEGMRSVAEVMLNTVVAAANVDELPAYRPRGREETEAMRKRLARPAAQPAARLGINWKNSEAGIIEVTTVTAGSPAERGGVQTGDVIQRFGGYDVGVADFRSIVLASQNPVDVLVRRGDQDQQLVLELSGTPRRVGLAWRTDDAEPGCLAVTLVIKGSPAAAAGLKAGDRVCSIDGVPIRDSDQARELLREARTPLTLTIERDGSAQDLRLVPLPSPVPQASPVVDGPGK